MHVEVFAKILTVVILTVLWVAIDSLDVRSLELRANYKLEGHLIGSFITTSHQTCVRYCYSFANCKSIDFNKENKTCNIHDADSSSVSSDLVFASGHVFSDIQTWPMELSGGCGSRPCTDSQCLSAGNSYSCLEIDCGDPGISKAVYNDTATMYQTMLNVSCEDGYIVDGYPYITCLADGSWSTPPTCLLDVCLSCYTQTSNMYLSSYRDYPHELLQSISSAESCIQTCDAQYQPLKIVGYNSPVCICGGFTMSEYFNDGNGIVFAPYTWYEIV